MNHKASNSMPGRLNRFGGAIGIAMIAVGLVLVGAVGAYYGYSSYARSQLDSLRYVPEEAVPFVPVSTAPLAVLPVVSQAPID